MSESPLERLAREITVMVGCGGPLHRRTWVRHIASALSDVPPLADQDVARLASRFGGSPVRAQRFVRGLKVRCLSFVEHPGALDWRPGSRAHALLDEDLRLLSAAINPWDRSDDAGCGSAACASDRRESEPLAGEGAASVGDQGDGVENHQFRKGLADVPSVR
jgi:hypothetical protein